MELEKKLRYSWQRERIGEYLASTKAHPSAEMIYRDLKEEISGLSLGTVYRNLKLLEEQGKIRRVTSHNGNERYDAMCDDHIHFVCESCGAIFDMPGCAEDMQRYIPEGQGFKPEKIDIIISGICPECER